MSDLPAYRRAARTVPCPYCEAASGQPCRDTSGRVAYEHRDRYRTVRPAQNIGYEEGLRDALGLIEWVAGKSGVNATVEEICAPIERQRAMVARQVQRNEDEQLSRPAACECPPCPGRGNDGHGLTHCAECCFGTGVVPDLDCPTHGERAYSPGQVTP